MPTEWNPFFADICRNGNHGAFGITFDIKNWGILLAVLLPAFVVSAFLLVGRTEVNSYALYNIILLVAALMRMLLSLRLKRQWRRRTARIAFGYSAPFDFSFFWKNLWQKNVLTDCQFVEQHKVLKNKAKFMPPYFCKFIFIAR